MSQEATSPLPPPDGNSASAVEPEENFADILKDFERSHARGPQSATRQIEGTVISVSADQVFLDIGYKIEGVLARALFPDNADGVKQGDKIPVSVSGRNVEGYYELSRFNVAQPRDWTALEQAFAHKQAVVGTVTGMVKGGLTVDVGVRAFMPASRSGARDATEMEKLVGTEINCRITKLDVVGEDVVVDRRVVLEQQARAEAQGRLEAIREGDTLTGTVRSLVSYGAFVDIGGMDGLLHVSDMAWGHVSKPESLLAAGQQIRVRVLKIDPESKKIALGLKQLEPEPWEAAGGKYSAGQRIQGTVTRLADFGAFVEIEPGIEGLIHISEMSWGKRVRHPSDVVQAGALVDAVILDIKPQDRRIALGLKQTLADPWSEVPRRYPVASQIEGPVTRLTKFGAFVGIAEGIEGLVHISEIVAGRRIDHPQQVLRAGQVVKAQVLAVDLEKRQIKLSIKQLIPTSIDEYVAEHKAGDVVSGRVVDVMDGESSVELGEGIRATCRIGAARTGGVVDETSQTSKRAAEPTLSALTSILQARWKGNLAAPVARPEPLKTGQIRSFKIVKVDAQMKKIELEPA
jgi:small subunit ribosomal protein S1